MVADYGVVESWKGRYSAPSMSKMSDYSPLVMTHENQLRSKNKSESALAFVKGRKSALANKGRAVMLGRNRKAPLTVKFVSKPGTRQTEDLRVQDGQTMVEKTDAIPADRKPSVLINIYAKQKSLHEIKLEQQKLEPRAADENIDVGRRMNMQKNFLHKHSRSWERKDESERQTLPQPPKPPTPPRTGSMSLPTQEKHMMPKPQGKYQLKKSQLSKKERRAMKISDDSEYTKNAGMSCTASTIMKETAACSGSYKVRRIVCIFVSELSPIAKSN